MGSGCSYVSWLCRNKCTHRTKLPEMYDSRLYKTTGIVQHITRYKTVLYLVHFSPVAERFDEYVGMSVNNIKKIFQATTRVAEKSDSKNMKRPAPIQLPSVIWRRILQTLPLLERLRLRSICKTLETACRPWIPAVVNVPSQITGIEEGEITTLQEALSRYNVFSEKNPSRIFEIRLGSGVHETGIICGNDIGGFNLEGSKWKYLLIRSPYSITYYGETGTLTYIKICEGVTIIRDRAFSMCTNLATVIFPDSVIYIGGRAFQGCSSLVSVKLPERVMAIGEQAFYGCSSLSSVIFPNYMTTIGRAAFCDCESLKTVNIPEGVITMGECIFSRCSSLISVTFPNSLKTIGQWAFFNCHNLTTVELPEGVITIGECAFSRCSSLISVAFPNSLKAIGYCTFYACINLTSVTLSMGVTTIAWRAFPDSCQVVRR